MTTKDQIIAILRETERHGIEAVINYLENSNYFTRGCYGHHKGHGGLAKHSLEVYEHMFAHAGRYPNDSIVVAGLFHDLGKTTRSDGRGHWNRSVDILDRLGFELANDERMAISHHHDKSGVFVCHLRSILSAADCSSTRFWKLSHPKHHRKKIKPTQ